MIRKVSKILECLFYIAYILLPCTLAVFLNGAYMAEWHIEKYLFNIIVLIVIILGISLFFFSTSFQISRKKELFLVFLLALAAFLFRLLIVEYADAVPASDFLEAYRYAKRWAVKGYSYVEKYSNYKHWGLWAFLMNLVFRVTGNTTLHTAQMINVCIDSSTVVIIYGIVRGGLRKCGEKLPYRKIAFFSAAIYSFMPGLALYTGVLTQEFLAAWAGALATLFLILANDKNNKLQRCMLYAASGILLGIMNWFKPISGILLIAWIIAAFIINILPSIHQSGLIKKSIYSYLLAFVLIIAARFVVDQGGAYILANAMGIERQQMSSSTWKYIYIGLNVQGNGKIDQNFRKIASELEETYSPEELPVQWKHETLKSIRQNYQDLPHLFLVKFQEEWTAEKAFYTHGTRRSSDLSAEEKTYYDNISKYNRNPLYIIFTLSLLLLLAFNIFAGIHLLRKNNLTMFMCSLIVFGFTLLEFIIEAQNRYKSVIYWALAVLAGLGMYELCLFLRWLRSVLLRCLKKMKVQSGRQYDKAK